VDIDLGRVDAVSARSGRGPGELIVGIETRGVEAGVTK
jgi:hypothetical protein